MEHAHSQIKQHDYAKCIEVSKRVRWDIEEDVIRGREFDFSPPKSWSLPVNQK